MPRTQELQVLPEALKAWRKERGLSQARLAAATQHAVSEGLIAQIETGRRQPGYFNGLAIAEALGVPLKAFALVMVNADEHDTEAA